MVCRMQRLRLGLILAAPLAALACSSPPPATVVLKTGQVLEGDVRS